MKKLTLLFLISILSFTACKKKVPTTPKEDYKTFIKDVITDQNVASALENKIVFALINAEEGDGPNLHSQFGGSGYPFFVIIDSSGAKLNAKQGITTSSDFMTLVTPYLK